MFFCASEGALRCFSVEMVVYTSGGGGGGGGGQNPFWVEMFASLIGMMRWVFSESPALASSVCCIVSLGTHQGRREPSRNTARRNTLIAVYNKLLLNHF